MSRQSWLGQEFSVATELAMVERPYVATGCGQMDKFCVTTRNFMLRQSLVMGGGSHVAT